MAGQNALPGFIINSTTIAVDYWPKQPSTQQQQQQKQQQQTITHYFLTHVHSDHTKNLNESWNGAFIYCSSITKKLAIDMCKVNERWLVELEMDTTHSMKLNEDETFNVTLIDANHCPGAVMFLFEGYFGCVLATGDFRYTPNMFIDTALNTKKDIEICYLDNTYFNLAYANLPSRNDALREIIQIIELKRDKNVLFAIQLRNLGKETLLVDLSEYFHTSITLKPTRYKRYTNVLNLDRKYFKDHFDKDTFIYVHDQDYSSHSDEEFANFPKEKLVIYIEPSALHYPSLKRPTNLKEFYSNSTQNRFQVPYSDHSSYNEIVEFVKRLRPKRLIPIVQRMLPKNIDTTDFTDINKYLSKKPQIKVNDKYKLLCQSVRRNSSVLHSFQLARNTSRAKSTRELDELDELKSNDAKKIRQISRSLSPNTSSTIRSSASAFVRQTSNVTLRRSGRIRKVEIDYSENSPEKNNKKTDTIRQRLRPSPQQQQQQQQQLKKSQTISLKASNLIYQNPIKEESYIEDTSQLKETTSPLETSMSEPSEEIAETNGNDVVVNDKNLNEANLNRSSSLLKENKSTHLTRETIDMDIETSSPNKTQFPSNQQSTLMWAKLNDDVEIMYDPVNGGDDGDDKDENETKPTQSKPTETEEIESDKDMNKSESSNETINNLTIPSTGLPTPIATSTAITTTTTATTTSTDKNSNDLIKMPDDSKAKDEEATINKENKSDNKENKDKDSDSDIDHDDEDNDDDEKSNLYTDSRRFSSRESILFDLSISLRSENSDKETINEIESKNNDLLKDDDNNDIYDNESGKNGIENIEVNFEDCVRMQQESNLKKSLNTNVLSELDNKNNGNDKKNIEIIKKNVLNISNDLFIKNKNKPKKKPKKIIDESDDEDDAHNEPNNKNDEGDSNKSKLSNRKKPIKKIIDDSDDDEDDDHDDQDHHNDNNNNNNKSNGSKDDNENDSNKLLSINQTKESNEFIDFMNERLSSIGINNDEKQLTKNIFDYVLNSFQF